MEKTIRDICRVNLHDDNSSFVGVKGDSTGVVVHFPIGYNLSSEDAEVRRDIRNLLRILSKFTEVKEMVFQQDSLEIMTTVGFPITSYMTIIKRYLDSNGKYYQERELIFKSSSSGRIDWAKTFRRQIPLVQADGSFIYSKQTVRTTCPDINMFITHVHKYCVYESFAKLGWLFVDEMPEKSQYAIDTKRAISALVDKLAQTSNDQNRILFLAMIDMLCYLDKEPSRDDFSFGTNAFEYVWEKMIDSAFGVRNKSEYFPKTKWKLNFGKLNAKQMYPLEPDTIMIIDNAYFVLDAKYYRYGVSGVASHLPNSSSINKQLTYGEYVYSKIDSSNKVYNAFIMPFNGSQNVFSKKINILNIGEATGNWHIEGALEHHQKVQGILIDTKYLMYNYNQKSLDISSDLASAIVNTIIKNVTQY